jgi:collagenase-like PrtC family protease
MHDLAAAGRLAELHTAGAAAVKIEGRMKNATWVGQAVTLYRQALQGEVTGELRHEIEALGAYTGRQMTCGYLDGQRDELTGLAGRRKAIESLSSSSSWSDRATDPTQVERNTFDLEILITDHGIEITCRCADDSETWTIPKTVVHRPHKAYTIDSVFDRLSIEPQHGCELRRAVTNAPEFLMVPRAVNALLRRIANTVQRAQKKRFEVSNVALPESVRKTLKKPNRCTGNRTTLGEIPDRVRLELGDMAAFLSVERPAGVVVEGATADRLREIRSACSSTVLVVALPPVIFEDQIEGLKKLLQGCARQNVTVEVNSWGGWWLAKRAGVRMESGPGLPVLNSLAARTLSRARIQNVTLSVEADRRQFKELTANCPVPCSLVVFGRPPLMISRVELPADSLQANLTDRRDNQVQVRRESGLWVVRPVTPFDLRSVHNEHIRVRHLVVDLVGSSNPVKEWRRVPGRNTDVFRFNYERGLR